MKSKIATMLPFLFVLLSSLSGATSSAGSHGEFVGCLSLYTESSSITKVIYTPNNSSYSSILQFNMQNLRFNTSSTPKPLVIVTPTNASHVQATVYCARKYSLQVIVRSGGHDFEGLSYVSPIPFVMVDLVNMSKIDVDVATKTAWIQAGVALGQLYYDIVQRTNTLAFPAGLCPTVGSGGHFSGGGYGILMRKYGLAADNIVDALLIDVNARILDRAAMGEDVFWAIRGGGGNTFGVVVAWKIQLVDVPPTVTIFSIRKTLEQNATKLVHRWQSVASRLPNDLWLQLLIRTTNTTPAGDFIVRADFNAMFLGGADQLVPLMQERFPELGVTKGDCFEMSWARAQANFGSIDSGVPIDPNISFQVFITRATSNLVQVDSKGKSDYVVQPIPEKALEGLMQRLSTVDTTILLAFVPYGGRMSEISESSIPFPHRAGYLYKIAYGITWNGGGDAEARKRITWLRDLYSYMTPYVSKNPRSAYVNYRDLDIGINNIYGRTSVEQASVWGAKYFKNNFPRLVYVKTKVDPTNFFRNEQSVPPFSH